MKGTATTAPGKYYGTAKKAFTAAAPMVGAAMEGTPDVVAPAWDPGPGEYLDPIRGYGRHYLGLSNPYRYGFGPGQVMVGGLAQATGGG